MRAVESVYDERHPLLTGTVNVAVSRDVLQDVFGENQAYTPSWPLLLVQLYSYIVIYGNIPHEHTCKGDPRAKEVPLVFAAGRFASGAV